MSIGYRSQERPGQRHAWFRLVFVFSILAASELSGQALPYFASAEGLGGETLKLELRGIINTGTRTLSYTPQVWDAHKDLYEDPEDSSRLILFYSGASWDKSAQDPGSGSEQYWNREHLWANSYGIDGSRPAYTDLFHLVPANKYVNNDRSNNYFDYADPKKPGYEDPANSIATQCKENSSLIWEPGDDKKGWVARAMLYMTTRYAHLELVDSPPSPEPDSSSNRMAQLSVMLEWNRRFPPSEKEHYINQRIQDDYQYNRNPYIDFPEFADAVWITGPSWGGWRLEHFSLQELLDPAVSGDLADPDGDSMANLVEMALYTDPRSPDPAPPISLLLTGSGLVLSFSRASDLSNLNLFLLLEESEDLQNWIPLPLDSATVSPDGPDRESVVLPLAIDGAARKYFRLKVIRP